MKVALVGQPNSGKSTVFNAVAGYRSLTSNFAGTTVEYTRGQARVAGTVMEVIDLPGLYSLMPTSAVEEVSRNYLLAGDWDIIINVVDASQLARSLELTLELLDLESPMVVCLNMMDEAARKGMTIDTSALELALGVPVVEATGGRGRGIVETFSKAIEVVESGRRAPAFVYAREAEEMVEGLAAKIAAAAGQPGQEELRPGSAAELAEAGERKPKLIRRPLVILGQKEGSDGQGAGPPSSPHASHCAAGCCSSMCSGTGNHGGHHHPELVPAAALNSPAGITPTGSAPGGILPRTNLPMISSSSSAADGGAKAAAHALAVEAPAHIETAPVEATVANGPSEMVLFPPARFQALQLVQSDPRRLRTALRNFVASSEAQAQNSEPAWEELAQAGIATCTGLPADAAISSARHAACLTLFECVTKVARPKADWRERVDHVAMHPIWGYAVLAAVFLGFFRLIFDVGKLGEDRILTVFDALVTLLTQHMNPQGALFAATKGAVLGTAGAVAIVLPYLLPFLIGLAILEDIGYLSRVGYLMDAAMHRLGLHGTATLPILVGYGCSVPAVMATRILTTRRDRFIAAFLAVLVPCSARMTVIFALVGFYLGANWALAIYVLNIVVVALSGHVLARLWPEISPGMLMEVPAYRVPGLKVVAFKTWWRLREFVLMAFPLLVVGSVVLSLVDFYGWQHGINAALAPVTALLGLPRSVGLTLIFGVLRKELSLLMLMQALGTTHVLGAMTTAQIVIFTLFVTFYLPCMATLASMMRELGWRLTLAASTALLALAVVISLAARGVFLLL